MARRWKEEVERLTGRGLLKHSGGSEVPVDYSLIVLQNVWERPALNAATTLGRGTHEISGSLLLENPSNFMSLSEGGTLVLEDGRELEIIVTRISDPRMPAPFRVSKADGFFS